MRKISYYLLLLAVILGMTIVNPLRVSAATQYTGGLLDSLPIQVGKTIGQPSATGDTKMTDNNTSTYTDFSSGNFAWYSFSSPVEISSVVVRSNVATVFEFYDVNNYLLQTYKPLSNDGIQTLPAKVQDVSTVVLKYTGSTARVYEWNVFTTPSVPPAATTISWIQAGDKIVKMDWAATGAKSYNVKRSTSTKGPYVTIANVTGTTYTDTTVTNGTPYFYVVSAVNEAGESSDSPEKSITPQSTSFTGGLLDGLPLQVGTTLTNPSDADVKMTDNSTTTYTDFSSGKFTWNTFASPVEISSVIVKSNVATTVEFYDANSNLLSKFNPLLNDGIQTLPAKVQGVATVVLKYTGSTARIYEWNVFSTPSQPPLPTTISWIQGGDQLVKFDWASTGAKSYNVKRATSSGGPYVTIANVAGTTYSDKAVTNGTRYYYVVSAVNEAGESKDSPEKNMLPQATKFTGGLLDALPLQVGASVTAPTGTDVKMTDNSTTTYADFSSGKFAWYTFSSPVEVSSVIVKSNVLTFVEFYDASNNLLQRYDLLNNEEVQTLTAPVQNVSTVVLKYIGSTSRIYEWNVFGKIGELPPAAPLNLTASAGDKSVSLNWSSSNNAVTGFNVKRAATSGGPYTQVATVTGDTYSYTDTNVANGVKYYYVVTAVTAGSESGHSNEASATPKSGTVTPPPGGGEEQTGDRALLRITLNDGIEKEYDLSMNEVNAFINWYEGRAGGTGTVMFAIDKHENNKGPFKNRKDYVFFDKIITFEVSSYDNGTSTPSEEQY